MIGIDPGFAGAVAVLRGADVATYPIPVHKIKSGKTLKKRIDTHGWLSLCEQLSMLSPDLAVFETVGGMPGQSAPAAFSFGFGTGVLMCGLLAHGVPVQSVTPQVWKRALGVPASADGARAMASSLIPAGAHLWQRAGQDGHAEAALMALYGARVLLGAAPK